MDRPALGVTGYTGYIGARLVRLANARAWRIVAIGRRPPDNGRTSFVPFDLGSGLKGALPHDLAALIHLAADTHGNETAPEAEIAAAIDLIKRFKPSVKRPFIFVSSQTAGVAAPTRYGRVKARIEKETLDRGGLVIRPGLVYGGARGGLYGALCDLVERAPVLPALVPSPKVQPIHIDDLCAALLRIAALPETKQRVFALAQDRPMSFTVFLAAIAKYRLRRKRIFIPAPSALVNGALAAAAKVAPRLEDSRIRLRSLSALAAMQTIESLRALDLTLRPLERGLDPRSGSVRRHLAREGAILIRYCAGRKPSTSLVKRYVRACEQLALPPAPAGDLTPWTLRLADNPGARRIAPDVNNDLARRLGVALAVAEASTEMADRFLLTERVGRAQTIMRLVPWLVREAFWTMAGAVFALVTLPPPSKMERP